MAQLYALIHVANRSTFLSCYKGQRWCCAPNSIRLCSLL